jgi:hypothetical protein
MRSSRSDEGRAGGCVALRCVASCDRSSSHPQHPYVLRVRTEYFACSDNRGRGSGTFTRCPGVSGKNSSFRCIPSFVHRSPLGFRPCCSLFCRTPNAATAVPFSVRAPSKLASGGPWLAGARGERCMHTFGTGAPRPYPTQPDPIRSIWISACPQQGNMQARTPGGTGG